MKSVCITNSSRIIGELLRAVLLLPKWTLGIGANGKYSLK